MSAPSPRELEEFAEAAVRLATSAGRKLLQFRRKGVVAESKGIRRELVTAADRAAEHVVVDGLQRAFPEHAVLAEEGVLTTRGVVALETRFFREGELQPFQTIRHDASTGLVPMNILQDRVVLMLADHEIENTAQTLRAEVVATESNEPKSI